MKRTPFEGTPLKGIAAVTVLIALALAACGNDSKAAVKRGTMQAVYADINRLPEASFKVTYDAQGAGLKRVTSYWKGGKARVDTMATTGNTRHYASGSGSLIASRSSAATAGWALCSRDKRSAAGGACSVMLHGLFVSPYHARQPCGLLRMRLPP